MANKKEKLTEWLASNPIQFETKKFSWPLHQGFSLHDVEIEMRYNGRSNFGRGISEDENLASTKAVVEALERVEYRDMKELNFSGFSAHTNEKESEIRAKLELIERDKLYCHYYTRSPFYHVNSDLLSHITIGEVNVTKLINNMRRQGLIIDLLEMKRSLGIYATICVVRGALYKKPFGVIIGLGCDFDLKESLKKALTECLPNIYHVKNTANLNYINKKQFLLLKNYNAIDVKRFGLHVDSVKYIEDLVINSLDEQCHDSDVNMYDSINVKTTTSSKFHDCPLFFSSAHNNQTQPSFWGVPEERYININRMKQFINKDFSYREVYKEPIVLG